MLKKIKNILFETDRFLYKKFGSDKSTKSLENIKEAQIIFDCLKEVKFVGGCVRKAICGEIIDDIDLATPLKPHEVKKILGEKNFKVFDTGISHGTITAIVKNKKFEITTLRKDVTTDGRHAKVEFTSEWREDALRRDFTINAIYSDIEGRIYDPHDGISDLKKGKINFIGVPENRIQEDYLRILRYFRFYNQYSKTDHGSEVIKSIRKNINGLNKISNERIFNEVNKILSLKNVDKLFNDEKSKEIILNVFPQFKYGDRLKNFKILNQNIRDMYDSDLILALLILDNTKEYEYFCYKFKTSNKTKERFNNISKNFDNLKSKKFFTEENIKKNIYLTNKKKVSDLLIFSSSIKNKSEISKIEKLIEFTAKCRIPKFPISGDDLKKYGYKSDKDLGKKLESLKDQWIKNNFFIDKKKLEKALEKKF